MDAEHRRCVKCGRSIPVQNWTLHEVRCQGSAQDAAQEVDADQDEQKQPVANDHTSPVWSCQLCTFDNEAVVSDCLMCGHPKGPVVSMDSAAPPPLVPPTAAPALAPAGSASAPAPAYLDQARPPDPQIEEQLVADEKYLLLGDEKQPPSPAHSPTAHVARSAFSGGVLGFVLGGLSGWASGKGFLSSATEGAIWGAGAGAFSAAHANSHVHPASRPNITVITHNGRARVIRHGGGSDYDQLLRVFGDGTENMRKGANPQELSRLPSRRLAVADVEKLPSDAK